ncbi:MAG: LacI family DNA-binding transcriptional regulator [Propionibacteriaceae bacterium]|nr:LacI family DNA-binding transcriptional regulator [Propionibacteriaceae bacterium]
MAASVKDVAALAGLSVGTVSNVLNRPDKVSEATRERVQNAIDQLGFVRNDAARQLKAGQSQCVGLVVLDASNPFFADVALGAERLASEQGVSVLVGNSAHDPSRELTYLNLFDQQRLRGVLLSPVGTPPTLVARMRQRGIPTVLVDRADSSDLCSSVSVDDLRGGRLAAEHLAGSGRRRLCFVGGPEDLPQSADRLAGARAAAASTGATLLVKTYPELTIAAGRRAAEEIAALPGADRPDGIFAANDLLALGLLQGFTSHGIRVPEDAGLIGYDDIEFAAGAAVPLSSIHQPRLTIGETAMSLLLAEADEPTLPRRHVVLQPTLVARASTRR